MQMACGVGQSLGAEFVSLSMHAPFHACPFAPMLHMPRLLPLWEFYYLQLALDWWLFRKSLKVSLFFFKKKVYSLISLQLYLILKGMSNFWIVLCDLVNDEFIEFIASKSQRVSTKKQRKRKKQTDSKASSKQVLEWSTETTGVACWREQTKATSSDQGNQGNRGRQGRSCLSFLSKNEFLTSCSSCRHFSTMG